MFYKVKLKILESISWLYRFYLGHKWLRLVILWFFRLNVIGYFLQKQWIKGLIRFFFYVVWRRYFCFPYEKRKVVNTVMGPPGSGKTSFAAYLALRAKFVHEDVYCNVAIRDTYKFSWANDWGVYLIKDATVIIDECALEEGLFSRDFKNNFDRKKGNFNKLETAKLHRHYGLDLWLFSQADDTDLKLRELSQNYWILRKTGLPWLLHIKLYDTDIDVDPMTQDFRKCRKLKRNYFIFSPVIWLDFRTDETPDLMIKDHWDYRS